MFLFLIGLNIVLPVESISIGADGIVVQFDFDLDAEEESDNEQKEESDFEKDEFLENVLPKLKDQQRLTEVFSISEYDDRVNIFLDVETPPPNSRA